MTIERGPYQVQMLLRDVQEIRRNQGKEPPAIGSQDSACASCGRTGVESYWYHREDLYGADAVPLRGTRPCLSCQIGIEMFKQWLASPKPHAAHAWSDLFDGDIKRIYLHNELAPTAPSPEEVRRLKEKAISTWPWIWKSALHGVGSPTKRNPPVQHTTESGEEDET